MKRESKKLLLAGLTMSVLVTGCNSPISDMSDMKNTTSQMSDTTKELNEKTTQVEDTSKHLDGTSTDLDNKTTDLLGLSTDMDRETNSLYIKERQGAALAIRKDMLNEMDKATTMEAKISFAGAYFMAFEYQIWGGSKEDDQTRLEGLYNCALQEYFREATQYMPEDYKSNPKVDPTSQNNKDMNMYALAVTMHMENSYEIKQSIDPSIVDAKPDFVSMYDLLQRGLKKKADRDSGKIKEADMKDWQKEVLNDEQAFEYMIRVRENFLPMMTLAQLSKIGIKGNWFQRMIHWSLFRAFGMTIRPWTADIKDLNTEQLITFTKWINDPQGALGAKGVLKDLGVDYFAERQRRQALQQDADRRIEHSGRGQDV